MHAQPMADPAHVLQSAIFALTPWEPLCIVMERWGRCAFYRTRYKHTLA